VSRHTIGFDDLKAIGIPHTLAVVMAMSKMAGYFPKPINGRSAKFPLWTRKAVEIFYAEHLAPNRRREPIGSARWWD
jgi:hypothetical protein